MAERMLVEFLDHGEKSFDFSLHLVIHIDAFHAAEPCLSPRSHSHGTFSSGRRNCHDLTGLYSPTMLRPDPRLRIVARVHPQILSQD